MKPVSNRKIVHIGAYDSDDKFTLEKVNSHLRQSDVLRSEGKGASVVKKRKRRRKGGKQSMGRYPFLIFAMQYLDTVRDLYAEATVKELKRRLRRMARDFRTLKEEKIITTDDPRKLSEKEIAAYIGMLRARGLKESGQVHNLSALKSVLMFCGNTVIDIMRRKQGHMFPRRRSHRFPPLEGKDINNIYRRSEQIFDWRRLEAYALVICAINTGMRTKELRLAKIGDLDRQSWRITVRYPKGKGTYGHERVVPVLPPARSIMTKYLAKRADMISKKAPSNEALFPAFGDLGDGYYSDNKLRALKNIIQEETGIRFDFRSCRRTFGQILIDSGVQIETVSLLLGHNNTKTTEGYYCRKREDIALREVSQIWELPDAKSARNLLIENEKYLSGYA